MLPSFLPQLSEFVRARLGLHFPAERFGDLERGVRAAAAELGLTDADACARWLLEVPHRDAEIAALASHLTIGETYFFRDPAAFDALERLAIPELQEAHARPLRIWSAACCTGEEAYSLAIAVRRAGSAAKILATDINPRFLEKAAAGVFGQWSFRGVAEEVRERYFEPVSAGRWKVAPALREMITFAPVNLFDDPWPRCVWEFGTMDIIFCRNVLMYFATEDARRVAGRLACAMNDGGWLFASAAEASHDLFTELIRADLPDVSAFRRLALPAERPLRREGPRPSTNGAPAIGGARAIVPAAECPPAAASPEPPAQTEHLDAEGHYLRGITLQEHGAFEESAAALRRALYLDPDFILAHFALGQLMLRMARASDAVRCLDNARALLHQLDSDAALPQGDGLTAARLLAIIADRQEVGT